jgi:hypothetical protein
MKWLSFVALAAVGLPALAHGQNSPAGEAAQPGNPADPAMQSPAEQAVPSDEPGTPPPASDPSSAAARLSDPDPAATEPRWQMRLASVLPSGTSAAQACAGFKSHAQCVSTLHAAQNLNIPFADLKSRVTHGVKLAAAIHALKPSADAGNEARRAEAQAHSDTARATAG